MTKTIIWALVMNSEQARVLRGLHRDGSVDAPELDMQTDSKRLQDIMSDRPGRSFSSADSRRSAMDYSSDPVRDAPRRFVDSVAALLDQHLRDGDFTALAIFASRPILGMLREEMSPALARTVISEVDKNLLHETPHDLPHVLAQTVFPLTAD